MMLYTLMRGGGWQRRHSDRSIDQCITDDVIGVRDGEPPHHSDGDHAFYIYGFGEQNGIDLFLNAPNAKTALARAQWAGHVVRFPGVWVKEAVNCSGFRELPVLSTDRPTTAHWLNLKIVTSTVVGNLHHTVYRVTE